MSLPATLGLGNSYYEVGSTDDTFGYFDIGAAPSMPLSALPARFGPWEMALSLHFVALGDNAAIINGGDDSEIIVAFGMSTKS